MLSVSDPADEVASEASLAAQDPDEMHAAVFAENQYPSARACGECHPKHFAEWSVSPHAYSQISPVFNTMQSAVTTLTNGATLTFASAVIRPWPWL